MRLKKERFPNQSKLIQNNHPSDAIPAAIRDHASLSCAVHDSFNQTDFSPCATCSVRSGIFSLPLSLSGFHDASKEF